MRFQKATNNELIWRPYAAFWLLLIMQLGFHIDEVIVALERMLGIPLRCSKMVARDTGSGSVINSESINANFKEAPCHARLYSDPDREAIRT
jgi:hypothetical protein